ncbi:MAG: hypothetical protein COT92_02810 [Candidatus Doudnabacteria bacterium CG10_big_fil_rev_8_21_14_0_10_42_18]|uniref:Uncharacterized protein n=1 Tax=Candidatus Doudnabacteria bacterium CG10_big_fil_rev_8_21_14_0_10_42_18 TaxID=1974552 RepID=A0A2H0VAM2_9BACT|nr:MAG: hypothetical protein COT92_02810 [Candidatus Doudnabacteria bacterium CG10_big_fil_rev_8_21_14_0_10_42_18]
MFEETKISAESFVDFCTIQSPEKTRLVKYLTSGHAAAFVVTEDFKIIIGLHGNHAPILKELRKNSSVNVRIISKGQISPLKKDVSFETSSDDSDRSMSSRDFNYLQEDIKRKILDHLGPVFEK